MQRQAACRMVPTPKYYRRTAESVTEPFTEPFTEPVTESAQILQRAAESAVAFGKF